MNYTFRLENKYFVHLLILGYFDKNVVTHILRDQFIQKWDSEINNSSHRQFYLGFKHDFCLENYLLRLCEYSRKWITEFRTSNLRFPIETVCWYNIHRQDRKCNFCGNGIADEFHILLFRCNIKKQIYTELL
jgi:hypothetical protein